jgi:hypothetical protein
MRSAEWYQRLGLDASELVQRSQRVVRRVLPSSGLAVPDDEHGGGVGGNTEEPAHHLAVHRVREFACHVLGRHPPELVDLGVRYELAPE